MFCFKVNSCTLYSCASENIKIRKCSNLLLILNEKFAKDWVIIVGIKLSEIIECDSRLQKHCFFEEIVRVIQRVSENQLRDI